MKRFDKLSVCVLLILSSAMSSCRGDYLFVPSEEEKVTCGEDGKVKGFYLLNEGNMGSNKATLDYYDYESGIYNRNIYPSRNPEVVKELGDVGNDLAVYGGKLYAVINCSHYVEVMDAHTARHVKSIDVANCRYVVFDGGKAYVSSYAGPVQIDPDARPGKVVEIDTMSLNVTREVVVGYQPEEMVVHDGRLYVANSGGYRFPNYDRTVSVIDLKTFEVVNTIDVAPNLHRMEKDASGNIYVSSRGDYKSIKPDVYVIDVESETVTGTLGVPGGEMCMAGDSLYLLSADPQEMSYIIYDTRKREIVNNSFISNASGIKTPYALAVNPDTREILVSDATDYVTPGHLYCYTADGQPKWDVVTGDIPSRIAFVSSGVSDSGGDGPDDGGKSPYITKVLDYRPAPGQFVNVLPVYEEGDGQEDMNAKALEAIGRNNRGTVTLGSWGGYIVVGFDHTIVNRPGLCDFHITSGAFYGAGSGSDGLIGGSCEPGIIMVARDRNGNGMPDDDEWYEIAGSSYSTASAEPWYSLAAGSGNDMNVYRDFEMTYFRPDVETDVARDNYIRWEDNKGNSGYKMKNQYRLQPYFPQWIDENELKFIGVRLPQNAVKGNGGIYVLYKFGYGYADNALDKDDGSAIDIDWAVDEAGAKVHLDGVDFIKIYTGVNQENELIGECSTELQGIEDLHLLGKEVVSVL